MASSVALKLENHIKNLEAEIAFLQEKLETAKQHQKQYIANKDVIETILGLELEEPVRKDVEENPNRLGLR